MSTTTTAPLPPARRVLPAEVNHLLGAWWVAIATTILAVLVGWPLFLMALDSNRLMPLPLYEHGALTTLGWFIAFLLVGLLVFIGVFVSSGIVHRRKGAFRSLKLSVLISMLVGLAAIGLLVFLMVQAKLSLGPAPILAGILLGMVALLPFTFGGLALSMASQAAIQEYLTEEEAAVTEAAEEGAPEEAVVETAAEEAAGEEVTVAADEEAGRPSVDALDSIFDEAVQEGAGGGGGSAAAESEGSAAGEVIDVPDEEMVQVFNLGLGWVFVAAPEVDEEVRRLVPAALRVGTVVERGSGPAVRFRGERRRRSERQ